MKDNHFNNKHHHKKDNELPKVGITPIRAEIHIPVEREMVKIPIDEFTGLVANSALLDTVKRVISHDAYGYYTSLRNMLGVSKHKEDGTE